MILSAIFFEQSSAFLVFTLKSNFSGFTNIFFVSSNLPLPTVATQIT
jgi:hypothetical protein